MKSFKVRLELNDKQTTLAKKHAGVSRFAYNWALAKCNDLMKSKIKKPTAIDLHKLWVAEVKSEKKWTYEVSNAVRSKPFGIWTGVSKDSINLSKTVNHYPGKSLNTDDCQTRKVFGKLCMNRTLRKKD